MEQHVSEWPDPLTRIMSRHVHHEAGHAVAAVWRGGTLIEIRLGTIDLSNISAETLPEEIGYTVHVTPTEHQPFATFAGPWAEAMWSVAFDGKTDFPEAFAFAWKWAKDGDWTKYVTRVQQAIDLAAPLGFDITKAPWEAQWTEELQGLWGVIRTVAAILLEDPAAVTHDVVAGLMGRTTR